MNLNLSSTFKIKPFKPKNSTRLKGKKKSRRCFATIVNDNGELKAQVSLNNREVNHDLLIIPLTEESLNLKGKLYVFTQYPDKHGKPACIIREPLKANTNCGLPSQYSTIKEGIVISGYVIKQNDKMYFEYEQLVSFSPNGVHFNPVKVDTTKPLFN